MARHPRPFSFLFVLLALLLLLNGQAHAASNIVIDGTITESDWHLIDNNSGGPAPGFGSGHEINALYTDIDGTDFYIGIAGNVQNNNRILLFIDSIASSGTTNGNFGRDSAPPGIVNFNSGTTFDAGFAPDYVLVIGTTAGNTNYFWDMYTLSGTAGSGGGPNHFLGDTSDGDLAAAPLNGSQTRGFEARLTIGSDLVVNQNVKLFAAYIADNGFLSNQFISPAGSGDGNYGGNAVTFSAAAPNPVEINQFTAVTLQGIATGTGGAGRAGAGAVLLVAAGAAATALVVIGRRRARRQPV